MLEKGVHPAAFYHAPGSVPVDYGCLVLSSVQCIHSDICVDMFLRVSGDVRHDIGHHVAGCDGYERSDAINRKLRAVQGQGALPDQP